jgi:hypothetical protein
MTLSCTKSVSHVSVKHARSTYGPGYGDHITIFYGRAEIHASFGQNIKISEKIMLYFICPENFLYVCENYGI